MGKSIDNYLDTALEKLKLMPEPTDENITKTLTNIKKELTDGWAAIADRQKRPEWLTALNLVGNG